MRGRGNLSPGPVLVSFAFRIDNILINYASMWMPLVRIESGTETRNDERNQNQQMKRILV